MINWINNQNVLKILMATITLCSLLRAQDVDLSGTVSGNNGKPLEGVKVRLAKLKNLSAVTNADGTFTLSNQTNVLLPKDIKTLHRFALRNNAIVFTNLPENVSGKVSLYSINGRLITSCILDNHHTDEQYLVLPSLSSGMYLLSGNLGEELFTQSFYYSGNDYLKYNAVESEGNKSILLKKTATAVIVDTLVAYKIGYDTTRLALDSYSKHILTITLNHPDTKAIESLRLFATDISPWTEDTFRRCIKFNASNMTNLINGGAQQYVDKGLISGFEQYMINGVKTAKIWVTDFGTASNANAMYKQKDTENGEKSTATHYNLEVAELDNSPIDGVVAYAHFGKYYLEMMLAGYDDKSEAGTTAANFIEVFETKIDELR